MGWAVNLSNLIYGQKAGGVTSVPAELKPAFKQAPQNNDAYGQYDRALEHGFAGEQYKNGKLVGGLLNFEC